MADLNCVRALAASLAILWTAPALAGPEPSGDHSLLQPFRAEYRINVSRIPTAIKAEMRLEAGEDDVYRMSLNIDSMLMKNNELSIFQWRDCEPRTLHYLHSFKGFRRERDYQMDFFWDTPPHVEVVTTADEEDEADVRRYDIPQDTLDELTMLLTARCLLDETQTDYELTTAYGKRLRHHFIQVQGRETLNTPLGRLETLRIEKRRDQDSSRRTVFWLAPALDYLLVRARHIEAPGLFGELRMTDYDGPFNHLRK